MSLSVNPEYFAANVAECRAKSCTFPRLEPMPLKKLLTTFAENFILLENCIFHIDDSCNNASQFDKGWNPD